MIRQVLQKIPKSCWKGFSSSSHCLSLSLNLNFSSQVVEIPSVISRHVSGGKVPNLRSPPVALDFRHGPTPVVRKPSSEFREKDVKELMQEDEALQSPDYFQVFNLFTVKDLFDARVHFGHKIGSLHKNMRPFIFGHRFEQVIFDLDITAFHLRQALNFIAHIAYRSGIILFVTRSPQTMFLVEKIAIECGEYAHTRHWETSIFTDAKNKFGGITRLPDLVILVNTLDTVLAPHLAIKDSAKMLIPTIGIVDSNCDPNLITYPIPGNDDTPCAVELYCKLFKEAIFRGKAKRKLHDNMQKQISEKAGSKEKS